MGRIGIIGDASGRRYSIKEVTSGEVRVEDETSGVVLARMSSTTIVDAGGIALNAHASRHAYGGADALPDNSLRLRQVKVEFAGDTTVSVAAGSTYTVPEGIWYVKLGANTRVELYIAGAWNTLIPAGGIGLIMSDGANVRLYNAGTASESSTLKEVR